MTINIKNEYIDNKDRRDNKVRKLSFAFHVLQHRPLLKYQEKGKAAIKDTLYVPDLI